MRQTVVEMAHAANRRAVVVQLAVVTAPSNDPATKAAARKKAARSGTALGDGSYPIPDRRHLFMAMQAFGRAPAAKRARVVAHIRRRARALGLIADPKVQAFLRDHAGGTTKGS